MKWNIFKSHRKNQTFRFFKEISLFVIALASYPHFLVWKNFWVAFDNIQPLCFVGGLIVIRILTQNLCVNEEKFLNL